MAQVNENREVMIQLSNVKKRYRLGQIGGGTLQGDLQSWWAKVRGKEDPNSKIGEEQRSNGETFMALNGIDLTIYKGEAVGIIGSNGAGKSTLLKLLSRVTAPTEGEIDIYGRIASMLEVGTGFSPEMTGRENVYMNGTILGMTKAEIDSKMEDIIEFSEVREFIDTPVKRYSSGMYVKLAFSVAAHLDSEIMIMDEVLAVGDMAFQKKCLSKMRDAAKKEGRTVLYVSHNMNTIRQLCDRCIVLDKGKVVYEGEVENAISHYMNNKTGEVKINYDVSKIDRKAKDYGKKIHLNNFRFLEKNIPSYFNNEKLKFEIQWDGIEDVGGVRLRMEIYNMDETIVGMAESKEFKNNYKAKRCINQFEFSLKNLAEGSYYFRLSVFVLGSGGVHMGLDDIPAIRFDVEDDCEDRTRWLKQYWGNIRFDDIVEIAK